MRTSDRIDLAPGGRSNEDDRTSCNRCGRVGWVTGSKANELARQKVQVALVEALTPLCVDKFNRTTDAGARLVELKKITSSWDRERYVRENDWAKFGKESNSRVVDACAAELFKL